MIIVALLIVLPPLLGKRHRDASSRKELNVAIYHERLSEIDAEYHSGTIDQSEYEQTRTELSRAVLSDVDDIGPTPEARTGSGRAGAVIVAIAVPAVSFAVYLQLGTPQAISQAPKGPITASANTTAQGQQPHSLDEMVARLEQRLQANPEDPEGWVMLARSYVAMNRLATARGAYVQAYQRRPNDPRLIVGYAEVLARLNGNRFSREAGDLLHTALRHDPDFPQALWLAGFAASERGDYSEAIGYWKRLSEVADLKDDQRRLLDSYIVKAGGDTQKASSDEAQSTGGPNLTVTVTLLPELGKQVAPTDTVFVFARAAQGPRMPLAIVKKQASELPLTVILDDSMAMTPQLKLSQFPAVIVGARVSKSGNATPTSGDLRGASEAVAPGAADGVHIIIGQRVP